MDATVLCRTCELIARRVQSIFYRNYFGGDNWVFEVPAFSFGVGELEKPKSDIFSAFPTKQR